MSVVTASTADVMTSRQRWLASLDSRPVDRLAFWPKLNASYSRAQNEPFRSMTTNALHAWIGSDCHDWIPAGYCQRRSTCDLEIDERNGRRTALYSTRSDVLRSVECFDAASGSWHPVEFPVKKPEDIDILTRWYEDTTVHPDAAQIEKAAAIRARADETGNAVLATTVGVSPLMYWIEHLAGVENGHLMLFDEEERLQRLLTAIHSVLRESTRICAENIPADLIYFSENTSTTLISPEQYRTHCQERLADYTRIGHRKGKRLCLHMCGLIKHILPEISAVGANAWEAFTSPPVANTRLLDGRTANPDVCIIGGTNAVLWTRPADDIISEIERDLNALPHHRGIVVTSAGVMPPACKPETIRKVREWVRTYPLRV